MDRRSFLKTGTGIGIAVGIGGCLGGEDDGEGLPDPLVFGKSAGILQETDFHRVPVVHDLADVAVEEEGFSGYPPVVAATVREDIHMGFLNVIGLVQARNEGFPVATPIGMTQTIEFPLFVSHEIEEWDDLRGKRIGAHAPESVDMGVARFLVNQELGDTDDVEFVAMAGTPNRIEALQAGELDAIAGLLPGLLQAEQDDLGYILAFTSEYETTRNAIAHVYGALTPAVDENEDAYAAIVDLIQESYAQMYERDPEDIVADGLAADVDLPYPDFDDEIWIETLERAIDLNYWDADGFGLDHDKLDAAQDFYVEGGLMDEDARIDPEEMIDDRFM